MHAVLSDCARVLPSLHVNTAWLGNTTQFIVYLGKIHKILVSNYIHVFKEVGLIQTYHTEREFNNIK